MRQNASKIGGCGLAQEVKSMPLRVEVSVFLSGILVSCRPKLVRVTNGERRGNFLAGQRLHDQ
jgi:hypothetical protein